MGVGIYKYYTLQSEYEVLLQHEESFLFSWLDMEAKKEIALSLSQEKLL
jgi:hypothetical protein